MNKRIKCNISKKSNAFIDGELRKSDFEKFQIHIKSCRICQNEIKELNKIDKYLSSYKDEEVPEDLNQKILASVKQISQKDSLKFLSHKFANLAIAASVALAFFAGLILSDLTFSSNKEFTYELGQESLYSYFEGVE